MKFVTLMALIVSALSFSTSFAGDLGQQGGGNTLCNTSRTKDSVKDSSFGSDRTAPGTKVNGKRGSKG